MQSFYVDTCVYLNLWKKEIDAKGNALWFFAKNFLELASINNSKIYYSGFILKELMFLISAESYLEKREFLENNQLFEKIILTGEEYQKVIEIRNEFRTNCSLFDIVHIFLSKKSNSILVTQDKELISLAGEFGVVSKRPQEIINC